MVSSQVLTELDAEDVDPGHHVFGVEEGRDRVELVETKHDHAEEIEGDGHPKHHQLPPGDGVRCLFEGALQSIHEQAITRDLAQIPK